MAIVKPEYWINLQGRQYPKYEGVLVAAHEEGLLGIQVTILQYPSAENGHMAVCSATVTMKGDGETPQEYTEIGDASPENVGPAIRKHILRMSATRAKGRALRDAIALGVALIEELGGDDDPIPAGVHSDGPIRSAGGQSSHSAPSTQRPVMAEAPVAKPSGAGSPPPGQVVEFKNGPLQCDECGTAITVGQQTVSLKSFSRPLCPTHQRASVIAKNIQAQSVHA